MITINFMIDGFHNNNNNKNNNNKNNGDMCTKQTPASKLFV